MMWWKQSFPTHHHYYCTEYKCLFKFIIPIFKISLNRLSFKVAVENFSVIIALETFVMVYNLFVWNETIFMTIDWW